MSTGTFDRGRLAKLLGLLGSDHDGEVVNAARAAEAMRRHANVTWADVLGGGGPRTNSEVAQQRARADEFQRENRRLKTEIDRLREDAAYCHAGVRVGDLLAENDRLWDRIVKLEQQIATARPRPPEDFDAVLARIVLWKRYLSDWERWFIDDLIRRGKRRLNPKQTATLHDILDKVEFLRRGAA